ncbi:hypothetical protein [Corynebacterium cystitidis]|uniref:hypothetical protein n=1 Tax=Corynebacterium cystitidis TaxID=35757 RepID=UPI00211DB5A3|nr:hypothetical protein [Corynebacterium cystitidis]
MGTENIIIHIPETPVPPQHVYDWVLTARETTPINTRRITSIHHAVIAALHSDGIPVDTTGDNCLIIQDYDETIPATLTAIEPALTATAALVILEIKHLVWRFGDATTDYSLSTSEYHAGSASTAGIPQWLDYITHTAETSAQFGIGSIPYDFLLIESNTKPQTYIQCYYDPTTTTNYQVEMRLGNADKHYTRILENRDKATAVIRDWMTGTDRDATGWEKMSWN